MVTEIPASGQVRIRVLKVQGPAESAAVHHIKARLLPRTEGAPAVQFMLRDADCAHPPAAGDRLRLTLEKGEVVGVAPLPPRKKDGPSNEQGHADA